MPHWKAGHWFGRSHADEFEVDGDDHEGVVAKSGRWFSGAWWDGHWLARTRCGEWRGKGEGVEACHRRKAHGGEHAFSSPSLERSRAAAVPDHILFPSRAKGEQPAPRRKVSDRTRVAGDYKAYLEARRDDADAETRGVLVNAAGRRRGISEGQFFTGSRRSSRYMSEELAEWFRQNGANLSAAEFRAQSQGAGGRRHVYDDAGVPY